MIRKTVPLLCALAGAAVPAAAAIRSVPLVPYHDPWPAGRERWYDVADNPLVGFLSGVQQFSYARTQVTLSYETNPPVPYFIGHLDAHHLKPNFSYQMKLLGKPVKGTWGWGAEGDDVANERLGYAARWFCGNPVHQDGTNFDDAHYMDYYKNALPGAEHNMYGYMYMGEIVTDGAGDAHGDFYSDYPFHIAWQSWQDAAKDVLGKNWPVQPTRPKGAGDYYGYGATAPISSVRLYYENQSDRVHPLTLPPGNYNCRFLITEESFHNPVAARPEGGYWKSVLCSEDLTYDAAGHVTGHDKNRANDVAFSIGADPGVPAMTARILGIGVRRRGEGDYIPTALVLVTDNLGHPIRDAVVTGDWAGATNDGHTQGATIGDGREFDGIAMVSARPVGAQPGAVFTFMLTNIEKPGRTWNKQQRPSQTRVLR